MVVRHRVHETTLMVALALAAFAGAAAAEPPAAQPRVEELAIENAGEGLVILIRTSLPVPRFACRLVSSPRREVVVELPGVASQLKSVYALSSPLVPGAAAETLDGEAGGLRIRLTLNGGSLSSVEQTEQGVRLRFDPGPAAAPGGGALQVSEYRVGVGDKLEIGVFGHEDLSKIVEVRGDGTINYPLVGDLAVVGKTVGQIDDEITKILGKDYLVNPQVSVDVREYQSQWVTVIGEVKTPGRYVLKRDMRLIDLLAEAGGATKDAGAQILITRRQAAGNEPRQITVDRDKLFSADNAEANVLLGHGDIVTLGEKAVFYIRGEVSHPGPYFLESGMTIMKGISVAGGFSQFANHREVELLRSGGDGAQKKTVVNLKAIEDGKKGDVLLRANDTVIVPRRIF